MNKTYVIVVGLVEYNGKFLLLKRTSKRHFEPDKWEAVSGYIKEHESAEETVLREVREETGIDGKIIRAGNFITTEVDNATWVIMPYLLSSESNIVINDKSEHSEYKWVNKDELKEYDAVKDFDKVIESLLI